jgi:hypothetical protein
LVRGRLHGCESCHRPRDLRLWRPQGCARRIRPDFLGHIEIEPPLNTAELHYLVALSASRRYDRPGGPYEVPGNPSAEHDECSAEIDIDTYNAVAPGQPSLWCDWRPCWDGSCLSFDGAEKFYRATQWLTYLIDHFLAPGARAANTGLALLRRVHVRPCTRRHRRRLPTRHPRAVSDPG